MASLSQSKTCTFSTVPYGHYILWGANWKRARVSAGRFINRKLQRFLVGDCGGFN